jgi:hypothetical protein
VSGRRRGAPCSALPRHLLSASYTRVCAVWIDRDTDVCEHKHITHESHTSGQAHNITMLDALTAVSKAQQKSGLHVEDVVQADGASDGAATGLGALDRISRTKRRALAEVRAISLDCPHVLLLLSPCMWICTYPSTHIHAGRCAPAVTSCASSKFDAKAAA